jgi:hypothetical protein
MSFYFRENTMHPHYKDQQFMQLEEIIAVYCENYTKPVNTPRGQNAEFSNVKTNATYSNHCALKGQYPKGFCSNNALV